MKIIVNVAFYISLAVAMLALYIGEYLLTYVIFNAGLLLIIAFVLYEIREAVKK